jgi:YidC/Oxa1 family membrane protein insertase
VDGISPELSTTPPPFPVDNVHHIGDLASMGLGTGWWPSDWMIQLLEFLQVSTQLPWWGSIALLTLILRISLFPLALKSARNAAIVPYFQDRQLQMMEAVKKARESGELVKMRQASSDLMDLYREWGYSPTVPFLGFLQIPIFFAVYRTMMRCSGLPVPGWENGGTLWFPDLTQTDPYLILPIISGVTTTVTIWVYRLSSR